MGQALYRKWRSQTFDEVIGQEHVTRTLRNALQQGRIAHAYLFTGPRGTGKTSTARLLARAVNCTAADGEKPCNQCATCRAIAEERMLDLIEIDAASHRGIDDIRDLREKVKFAAGDARYKVYIIDEVHALTPDAFNALLKTLEEPPPHVIFVLATTEPHKVPTTVLSRCQRFDFRPIPLDPMVKRLGTIVEEEGLKVEPQALELIARSATGSLRDAISLLDQLSSYGADTINVAQVRDVLGAVSVQLVGQLLDRLVARDMPGGLALIDKMVGDGLDPRQLSHEVVDYVRSLLLLRSGSRDVIVNVTSETLDAMQKQAQALPMPELVRLARLFTQAGLDLKGSVLPQLPLELAYVEAVLPPPEPVAQASAPPATRSAAGPGTTAASYRTPEPQAVPIRAVTDAGATAKASLRTPQTEPATASGHAAEVGGTAKASLRTPQTGEAAASPRTPDPVSAGASGGSPELSRVAQVWPRVVASLRDKSPSLQAFLRDGRPLQLDGDEIVVGFLHDLHCSRVSDAKSKAMVEQALDEALGRKGSRVRCVVAGKEPVAARRPAPPKAVHETPGPTPSAAGKATHPVVDYAVNEMGAKATPMPKGSNSETPKEELV